MLLFFRPAVPVPYRALLQFSPATQNRHTRTLTGMPVAGQRHLADIGKGVPILGPC
jgi:hypothetical protein